MVHHEIKQGRTMRLDVKLSIDCLDWNGIGVLQKRVSFAFESQTGIDSSTIAKVAPIGIGAKSFFRSGIRDGHGHLRCDVTTAKGRVGDARCDEPFFHVNHHTVSVPKLRQRERFAVHWYIRRHPDEKSTEHSCAALHQRRWHHPLLGCFRQGRGNRLDRSKPPRCQNECSSHDSSSSITFSPNIAPNSMKSASKTTHRNLRLRAITFYPYLVHLYAPHTLGEPRRGNRLFLVVGMFMIFPK
jgi:hypothetical protein